MRRVPIVAALAAALCAGLGVSAVTAQEAANPNNQAAATAEQQANQGTGKQGNSDSAQSTEGQTEDGKQVVRKPVIADDKNSVQQAAATERPLHEHPTLVQMLFRNNEMRGTRGLWAHRINPALTSAAQDHASYMARTRDFSHYGNGGPSGRAARYGFAGGVLENIAWGYGDVNSTFNTWRNSSGHWANMTSSTTDAGFGFAIAADGTPYWVAVYGTAGDAAGSVPAAQPAAAATTTYQNNTRRGLFRRR
ncbi:MAG: CAP domain-containing protein [Planctomycetota bacterium]